MLIGDDGFRHGIGGCQNIDVQCTGAAMSELLHLIRDLVEPLQRFLQHAIQSAAILRQDDIASAGSDQRYAEFSFQTLNGFGNGRLSDMHSFSSTGNVLEFSNRGKVAKLG